MKTNKNALISTIWGFVKSIGANKYGYGINIRRKDIVQSVFNIENELRISGEEANIFSDICVNYYDYAERAEAMLDYLNIHGWVTDWYSPGYMIATKEKGK